MPRLVGALDRRHGQRIDGEFAAKQLEHAQLLHAHFQIDRGDLERGCVSRVVKMQGHGVARNRQHPVQAAILMQQLLAILRDLDQPVMPEILEDRP